MDVLTCYSFLGSEGEYVEVSDEEFVSIPDKL